MLILLILNIRLTVQTVAVAGAILMFMLACIVSWLSLVILINTADLKTKISDNQLTYKLIYGQIYNLIIYIWGTLGLFKLLKVSSSSDVLLQLLVNNNSPSVNGSPITAPTVL